MEGKKDMSNSGVRIENSSRLGVGPLTILPETRANSTGMDCEIRDCSTGTTITLQLLLLPCA